METVMNAPERIRGLMIVPGVVSLQKPVAVDVAARKRAAGAILRQLKHAKRPRPAKSARHYLARVRSRYDR
jgi:hypothetical protein